MTVDVCNLTLQITISSAIPIRYYKMGKVFGPTICVALEFSQRGSIELTKSNKNSTHSLKIKGLITIEDQYKSSKLASEGFYCFRFTWKKNEKKG